jgi:hypothetical protein
MKSRFLFGTVLAASIGGLYGGYTVTHEPAVQEYQSVTTRELPAQEKTEAARVESNDPKYRAGVCSLWEGAHDRYACFPMFSPDGGVMKKVMGEDSPRAHYSDGYVFDADGYSFHK